MATMTSEDWPLEANRTVSILPAPHRRRTFPIVLLVLAAVVLFWPARNYYVQWSAIQKAQAAFIAKDYAEAFRQWKIVADAGNPDAQNNIGLMYWLGQGVAQNDAQAVSFWRKTAEAGNLDGASGLSQAYYYGRGVGKDDRLAFMWARKAADKGHANGQYVLGVHYSEGRAVAKDDRRA
ncbi:MAG: sel1 repeat family protein, partial [Mesorhizobium sp.]